jgi:branched-chain amino acid aminotransferase
MELPVAIERTSTSRLPQVDLAKVEFSSVMSDHMLIAEHRDGEWGQPVIRPYGPLPLVPAISALQYAVSAFEGLKAHRLPDGAVALFRPEMNARRFARSASRLAMPPVPETMFEQCLEALVGLDAAWVPPHGAGALYIRPCLFSTDPSLRVKPAEQYLFVIATCPFSAYFAAPVDVLVTDDYVRAFPGGTGAVKPAGNYAPALLADLEARRLGCHTVLWLDGRERRYVEECGVMNVFFVIGDEVITPPLEGTILPGVTRDSAITLLAEMGCTVRERRITIDEVIGAHGAATLRECFGTGTAATVAHVRSIRRGERQCVLPPVEERTVGPALRERLVEIATGRRPDSHGWLRRVG